MKRLLKSFQATSSAGSRTANLRRLLAALQRSEALTVRALAKQLDLSVPTVSTLLRELESHGVIRQDGTDRSGLGRAARRYALVPTARAVLLLDTGSETHLRGWMLDLLGQPLAQAVMELPPAPTHHQVAQAIASLSEHLERQAESSRADAAVVSTAASTVVNRRILGTVISIPGVNPEDRGVVVHSANRVIEGMPLARLLDGLVPSPLLIVNDANLAAVGAAVESRKADLVFVLLGRGLGMGVYLDHEVRTGGFGFAGEIGHIPLGDKSETCYCGQRDCLERTLSLGGMAERFAGKPPGSATSADVDSFLQAVEREDAAAVQILRRAGEALEDLAITIANFLDPDTIAVATPARPVLSWLQRAVESAVQAQVLFSHLRPMVVKAVPDLDAVLQLGAVELMLRRQPILSESLGGRHGIPGRHRSPTRAGR